MTLKKTRQLIAENPNIIVYAMDEAGIKREATVTSCWCPRGKTSVVMSPATHEKVSLVGAVRIDTGELIGHEVERFDRFAMIEFIKAIEEREKGHEKPIYVILDNARPHHAKDVQTYIMTTSSRVNLLFLPPYSPELNPSENIWRQLRKERIHNMLFRSLSVLQETIHGFFESYAKPSETMRSICALY
jgi:putative transposase